MSTNTPPEVGTTMKWGDFDAEVVLSSPEYLVIRDEDSCFFALQYSYGVWCDNEGDVWVVEEPEPPTLPVGTALENGSFIQTVVGAAPGFVLVLDRFGHRNVMAWIDDAWRFASDTRAWTVQP